MRVQKYFVEQFDLTHENKRIYTEQLVKVTAYTNETFRVLVAQTKSNNLPLAIMHQAGVSEGRG